MNSLSKAWLFTADIRALTDDDSLASLAGEIVSDERRTGAQRINNTEGRCRSLGAEILLRAGLEACGVSLPQRSGLSFEYRKNGKPYLTEPEDVYFNISHSGDMVICAIAPFEVGCDIEQIVSGSRTSKIAKRYFTGEEQEFVDSSPDRTAAFYRMWTLKESFMKVTGLGLALPLTDFCIHMPECAAEGLCASGISVTQNVDSREYAFFESDCLRGYAVSVCEADGNMRPGIETVSLENYIKKQS